MTRWLWLLASLTATAIASSPWWCTGEKHNVRSLPKGATKQDEEELALALELAELEARNQARRLDKGPQVTLKMIEAAQMRARDEAHDRFHLRQIEKLKTERELQAYADSMGVPVEALVEATALPGPGQKAARNER